MSRDGEADGFGKDERERLRGILRGASLADHEILELLVLEGRHRGCRPRKAWRLANELTQEQVADEFNRLTGKSSAPMTKTRISEYESWPGPPDSTRRRPRPTLRVLRTLAVIYQAEWDQLVDAEDLERMPARDVAIFRAAVARRSPARAAADGAIPLEMMPFVGRAEQTAELHRRVEEHLERGGPAVHVITGLAGIGKTALVRRVVDAHADRYPDGLIWEDLNGHTDGREPRTPAAVLEQLLLRIGVAPETIEADPARRAHRWREETRGRRMLLIFDNVLDSQHVRMLLPQAPECFVLITSRRKLTGLSGAAPPLQLDALTPAEAEELFVQLSHLPPDYDEEAVGRILRTAGRLPLAIRLIGGQIAHGGEEMLAAVAAEFDQLADRLRQAPTGLPTEESAADHILKRFTAEGETLYAAFELSYKRLPEPELRRAVRLLGWFPGSEITAETLAPMAAVSEETASTLIHRISEVGFLDRTHRLPEPGAAADRRYTPGPERYRIHDVTRLFARARADMEDMPSEHAAAIGRLVRYCVKIGRQVPMPRPFELAGSFPFVPGPDPSGARERARAWLTRERRMLLGCVRVAGSGSDTGKLARMLALHLADLGHWSDAWSQFYRALTETRASGDRTAECDILFELGSSYRRACRYETAASCFTEARAIAAELDDPLLQVAAAWAYAEAARLMGDYDPARRAYNDVLGIARQLENLEFEGHALRGLGHIERVGGERAIAHDYYLEALVIAGHTGDRYSLGWSLWGLAELNRLAGEFDTARDQFDNSLRIAEELDDTLLQVDVLRGLGHIARELRDIDLAQELYSRSLGAARDHRDPHGEADALLALARLVGIAAEGKRGDERREAQRRVGELRRKALWLYESMGVKWTGNEVDGRRRGLPI